MPLPTSGPLSLNDIQTEFGGTNPIELNEYYAGGGLVPAGTTGTFGAVPSSGTIGIQNFYGTAKQFIFYSWGQGTNGQLGDNTAVDKSSPVLVVGGFTDWISIAGGGNSTNGGGIRNNGTAWSWGVNSSGQLGDGTTINRSSPVLVIGGITDWNEVFVSGGANFAAIRNNGTVWGWGFNSFGQIGDGTTTTRSSPVLVLGGFTNWKQINVSNRATMAIKN